MNALLPDILLIPGRVQTVWSVAHQPQGRMHKSLFHLARRCSSVGNSDVQAKLVTAARTWNVTRSLSCSTSWWCRVVIMLTTNKCHDTWLPNKPALFMCCAFWGEFLRWNHNLFEWCCIFDLPQVIHLFILFWKQSYTYVNLHFRERVCVCRFEIPGHLNPPIFFA